MIYDVTKEPDYDPSNFCSKTNEEIEKDKEKRKKQLEVGKIFLPKMSIIHTGSKNYLPEPRFILNILVLKLIQDSIVNPLYAKNQMSLKVNQKMP